MNVTVTDITETRKDLIVTVSGEEIATEEARILRDFIKEAKLPGFRPGKAPETMIRSRYKKQINEELKRAVASKVYKEAVEDNKDFNVYTIVDFPELDNLQPGVEATVDLSIDVIPGFELPPYKGIAATVPPVKIEDKEVDDMIDEVRRQRADFVVAERPAAKSDYVKLSYTGLVDDQPIAEQIGEDSRLRSWATVENGWEEAGTDEAKQFGVPAIIDGIIGMQTGDKKDIEQVLADDFQVEELRGKTVKYSVEVHEVRERKMPDIDEAFLKSLKVESLEEFKDRVYQDLEKRKRQEVDQTKRQQIIDNLMGQVDFALPESAIEGETQNVMGRIMVENMQRGVPEEEFEKNKEALHAQSEQIARRDVKLQLILSRIAKEESITVENADLQRAVYSMAMQQRKSPDEIAKELQKNRSRVIQLQRQILFGKTLDFLVKEANVTESEEHAHDHDHDHAH